MFLPALALLALLLATAPARAVACDVPPEVMSAARPLPGTARALQQGGLRILILGSGSIIGPGSSGPDSSWPARLQSLLAARFPGRSVDVALRGGRGVSVHDHLALLREDGLVATRREAQAIFYRIADPKVACLLGVLRDLYCPPAT
jgi:DNA-binding transcriptional ArsR family regulator